MYLQRVKYRVTEKKKIRLSNCWISLLAFGEVYKRDNGLFKIEVFENKEVKEWKKISFFSTYG